MLATGRIYYRERFYLPSTPLGKEGIVILLPRSLPPWSLPSPSVEILHLFGKGFSIPS
jgi:hypothetical protein